MTDQPNDTNQIPDDAGEKTNWGRNLFITTLVLVLVFFWWLLIYSGGVTIHHG